eukprot:TRINITY_DN542_c0_g1_i1.p1 TRINITY_DN542_c0_g1~~TRINITY_DN542_c0_g1_i1.p1  ORF type:complete len:111 (-),score=16.48 TRINITY_DN542_c0_g1_i1:177-509(-)
MPTLESEWEDICSVISNLEEKAARRSNSDLALALDGLNRTLEELEKLQSSHKQVGLSSSQSSEKPQLRSLKRSASGLAQAMISDDPTGFLLENLVIRGTKLRETFQQAIC